MTAGRLLGLDILRAVAILLVLGRHLKPATPADGGWFLATVTTILERGGWIGVDVFFVLSGFLVSGLLFQEYHRTGTVHLGRFLIRRGFKIYPPFYVLLVVVISLQAVSLPSGVLAAEVFFLQNYVRGVTLNTWSLAVEEHFYLTLAALVWWLVRAHPDQPFRWIPRIWLTVAITCLVARFAITDQPYSNFTHLFPTHLRIDGLMFGVLLSYGWHCGMLQSRTHHRGPALIAIGLAALAPAFIFPLGSTQWIPHVGLTLFYLGSGALVLGFLACDFRLTPITRAVATLGAYSYSIYLWHGPIQQIARGALGSGSWIVYAGVYLIGAILLGMLAARLIEQPSLAVRDKCFPRTPTPTANPVAQAI